MDKAGFKRMLLEALSDPDVLAALHEIVLNTPSPDAVARLRAMVERVQRGGKPGDDRT
jgi:hypothetical protein